MLLSWSVVCVYTSSIFILISVTYFAFPSNYNHYSDNIFKNMSYCVYWALVYTVCTNSARGYHNTWKKCVHVDYHTRSSPVLLHDFRLYVYTVVHS